MTVPRQRVLALRIQTLLGTPEGWPLDLLCRQQVSCRIVEGRDQHHRGSTLGFIVCLLMADCCGSDLFVLISNVSETIPCLAQPSNFNVVVVVCPAGFRTCLTQLSLVLKLPQEKLLVPLLDGSGLSHGQVTGYISRTCTNNCTMSTHLHRHHHFSQFSTPKTTFVQRTVDITNRTIKPSTNDKYEDQSEPHGPRCSCSSASANDHQTRQRFVVLRGRHRYARRHYRIGLRQWYVRVDG